APLGQQGGEGADVRVVIGGFADEDVATVAGAERVLADAPDENVAAGAAEELVTVGPADEDVVGTAAARVEIVVAGIAEQVSRHGKHDGPTLDDADVVVARVSVGDH